MYTANSSVCITFLDFICQFTELHSTLVRKKYCDNANFHRIDVDATRFLISQKTTLCIFNWFEGNPHYFFIILQ